MGVFDKKRLYPKDLKDTMSFRAWAERFVAWVSMDNEEVGKAFERAARQEKSLDVSGLTAMQVAYSKAVYNHLTSLTEGYKKAARIVRLVKNQNGLEAWRRLTKRFDPQNPAVHAADLEAFITFGAKNVVKSTSEVEAKLNKFERALDDYEEATGECGINDSTKKTIMMQILPPALKKATRDTLMAAQQKMADVTPEYLQTIIVQRCEFDDEAMGSAVPMDLGAVDAEEDDAGSLGQRGVGVGAGKGAGKGDVPNPPSRAAGVWKDKYDMKTNNGFRPGTCGGCGATEHFRKDCHLNPNRGKPFPKPKAKAKAKAALKRRAGAVEDGDDDDDHDDDAQKGDEGGSIWDDADSDEGAWAV